MCTYKQEKISELLRIKTTKVIQKCIIKGEIMVNSKQDVIKARVFTPNPCILVDQIDDIIKILIQDRFISNNISKEDLPSRIVNGCYQLVR